MKNIRLIILTALLAVTSCYVDRGNYDYVSISDIEISGIENSYSAVAAIDTLRINPQIVTEYDSKDLEYTWLIYDKNDNCDTVSREKNLKFPVDLAPGTYSMFYYVKNKTNTYYVHTTFSLSVSTLYSLGHYILKENANGDTDIDILLDDDRLITDVIFKTQGSSLEGTPRSMGILYNKQMVDPDALTKTSANCVGIITNNNTYGVFRTSDMRLIFDRSNIFYEPQNEVPYKFITFMWCNAFITNRGVYSEYNMSVGSGLFGFPEGVTGGSSKWAFSTSSLGLVIWDETNSKLLYTTYNAVASDLPNTAYPTTNYTCLFMGSYKNTIYALFKDKTTAKLYLYKITATSMSKPPTIASVKEIASTSKLNTATCFACNERTAQLIYFVENNKPYYYDITNNAEYELNFTTLPADQTISYISNRFNRNIVNKFDYLTVATYKGGNYYLYMYNMVGGLPYGAPVRTATGSGKVKETHYVTTSYDYTYDMFIMYGMDYGYSK